MGYPPEAKCFLHPQTLVLGIDVNGCGQLCLSLKHLETRPEAVDWPCHAASPCLPMSAEPKWHVTNVTSLDSGDHLATAYTAQSFALPHLPLFSVPILAGSTSAAVAPTRVHSAGVIKRGRPRKYATAEEARLQTAAARRAKRQADAELRQREAEDRRRRRAAKGRLQQQEAEAELRTCENELRHLDAT